MDDLGGDAANVEAGATKRATLLDASSLETKLSGFDGGDIAARAATDDDDVVIFRSRSKSSGEGRQRERVPQGLRRDVPRQKVALPSCEVCHSHCSRLALLLSGFL